MSPATDGFSAMMRVLPISVPALLHRARQTCEENLFCQTLHAKYIFKNSSQNHRELGVKMKKDGGIWNREPCESRESRTNFLTAKNTRNTKHAKKSWTEFSGFSPRQNHPGHPAIRSQVPISPAFLASLLILFSVFRVLNSTFLSTFTFNHS